MNKIKVITDSCSDMGKELRERFGMDYARMSVNWSGEEKFASTDWDLYSVKEFYDAMRAGIRITTNQVTAQEFERVFSLYLEQGYDIVYVACSSGLSGSYSVAQIVAKNLEDKYPNNKVLCVDPLNACCGEGLVAIAATQFAEQGLSVDEVAQKARDIAPYAVQFCAADDLNYLKRAGRVKATAAFFGNLFGIKPIIISNDHGVNEAVKKIKGKKNAQFACVDMLKAAIDNGPIPASEQLIFVAHADCDDDAQALAERVKQIINPKEVVINTIGPTIGASVGPGTIAVYGFGDPKAGLEA